MSAKLRLIPTILLAAACVIALAPMARAAETPTTSPGFGSAQVLLSPPGTTFRVGGGPYTVPISISGAAHARGGAAPIAAGNADCDR